jgi:hypothetical protein
MRRLENYVRKYGPEVGPVLYHTLQSQAAHAGVSARLRRKIDVLLGRAPETSRKKSAAATTLPLFPEAESEALSLSQDPRVESRGEASAELNGPVALGA